MSSSTLWLIAAVFTLIAVLLSIVFLRITLTAAADADGVIVAKAFRPASTYTQVPVGMNRGMRAPTNIPIAESYVCEIRVEGLDQNVFFDLNTVASREFEVGQRVRITYRHRGVPFVAKKYLVLNMKSVTSSPSPGR